MGQIVIPSIATISAGSFANPTALVGLVPVNGVGTRAIRFDSAPALDQSINPTWSGAHTFRLDFNGTEQIIIQNNSAGAIARAQVTIGNGTGGGAFSFTGTGWVGNFFPASPAGAPTGAQEALYTSSNNPLVIGTFDTLRAVFRQDGPVEFVGEHTAYPIRMACVSLGLQGANPSHMFVNPAGVADEKLFQTVFTAGRLIYRTVNDAFSDARSYLDVDRTAVAISNMDFGNATDAAPFNFLGGARLTSTGVVNMPRFTVAALPAGTIGDRAIVTNALAPAFGAAVAGGGAVVTPVYFNGAAWIVG